MFDFDLITSADNLDVRGTIQNNDIKDALDLVLFFVGNGDLDRILPIVCPSPVQHAVHRFNSCPRRRASTIVPRDIEQTGYIAAVLIKAT